MDKCPAKKTPDKFNEFVGPTTAINIPFPQAIPKKATINAEFCRKLTSGKCRRVRQGVPHRGHQLRNEG